MDFGKAPASKVPVAAPRPPPPSGPTGAPPKPATTATPAATTASQQIAAPASFAKNVGLDSKGYAKLVNKVEYSAYSMSPSKLSDWSPVTILVEGEKNASKSCAAAGIPRPLGGKTYFITGDNTTLDGLANYKFFRCDECCGSHDADEQTCLACDKCIGSTDYHFARDIQTGKLVVFEVCKRFFDPKTGKEMWPGYDPNRSWTAELVFAKAMQLLEQIEKQNDGDVVVIDHFQEFYENVMKSLVFYQNGLDPAFQNPQFQHWEQRTRLMTLLEYKARTVARFATVITGYGEEEKNTMVPDIDPVSGEQRVDKNGKPKTKVVKENKVPSWISKFQRNYIVVLHLSSFKELPHMNVNERATEEAKAATRFFVTVVMSKRARFPQGRTFDITGSHLGYFWKSKDPSLDQPVKDDEKPALAESPTKAPRVEVEITDDDVTAVLPGGKP